MVKIELVMFLANWYIFLCCLISYHLYNKNVVYCIFYEKKKPINYYFRFVSFFIFLYRSFLLFLAETSLYDTVYKQNQLLVEVEEVGSSLLGLWKAKRPDAWNSTTHSLGLNISLPRVLLKNKYLGVFCLFVCLFVLEKITWSYSYLHLNPCIGSVFLNLNVHMNYAC